MGGGVQVLGRALASILYFSFPNGLYRGPGLGNFGAILGWFLGAGGAVLCAKRKEINTAFVSQSIAPKSLHETMFREHFSGN